MSDPETQARIKDEALFGRLPLLRSEREYSTRGMISTGFTYAVAAWCFLIGGYSANVVGAAQGVVTMIAGCTVGVVFSAAASALACNRYGLEQIDFCKSCFGQRGARFILFFYIINQIGWTGMILVMFGKGVTNVAGGMNLLGAGVPNDGGGMDYASGENLIRLAVLLGLIVGYWVINHGVHVLNVFNSIVFPGLLVVTAFLYYAIFHGASWHDLTLLKPLHPPSQDPLLNYIISFEFGLGAGFSWWPGIGFLTRNTDTQRNSLYPQVLTMGFGMGVVCCTGLLAGLEFRAADPTVWMIRVGGPLWGVASLILVAVANVSASAMMMYTAALALRHLRFLRSLPWSRLTLLGFFPVLAYVAIPSLLYDKGSAFLAINATMFAPISGVLLVDYFLLRRQQLNVSQIFEDKVGGDYWFTRGFNIPALFCTLLGMGLYIWLLDPISNTARGPVRFLTASGPAVLFPMMLYAVMAYLWLLPKGLGAYRADTSPRPLEEPNI